MFADAALIALWGVLGTTRRALRLMTVLAAIVHLAVLTAFNDEPLNLNIFGSYLAFIGQAVALKVAVFAAVKWRRRLFLVHSGPSSSSSPVLQITIRQLLGATTLVAVLTALAGWVRSAAGDGLVFVIGVLAVCLCACALELAAVWATLGAGRPIPRLALVLLLAFVIGAMPPYYFAVTFGRRVAQLADWQALFALQTIITAASLLVVRSCGWRLMRDATGDHGQT
jgi:hypothetical protein